MKTTTHLPKSPWQGARGGEQRELLHTACGRNPALALGRLAVPAVPARAQQPHTLGPRNPTADTRPPATRALSATALSSGTFTGETTRVPATG